MSKRDEYLKDCAFDKLSKLFIFIDENAKHGLRDSYAFEFIHETLLSVVKREFPRIIQIPTTCIYDYDNNTSVYVDLVILLREFAEICDEMSHVHEHLTFYVERLVY